MVVTINVIYERPISDAGIILFSGLRMPTMGLVRQLREIFNLQFGLVAD